MKQVIQNYRTGRLELAQVPAPMCSPDTILVKNVTSLVSIGTDLWLVSRKYFGEIPVSSARFNCKP